MIDNAARLGDAHGDHAFALRLLENGLARFTDAPTMERVRALLYRAKLAVRVGDRSTATSSLDEALSLAVTDQERTTLAAEIDHATKLVDGLDT